MLSVLLHEAKQHGSVGIYPGQMKTGKEGGGGLKSLLYQGITPQTFQMDGRSVKINSIVM
jgi:hypothetical protein